MNRRSFLATMFAAGMAPAVVRAESLMRIVVPSPEIILPNGWLSLEQLQKVVRTMMECDMRPTDAGYYIMWQHADNGPIVRPIAAKDFYKT